MWIEISLYFLLFVLIYYFYFIYCFLGVGEDKDVICLEVDFCVGLLVVMGFVLYLGFLN